MTKFRSLEFIHIVSVHLPLSLSEFVDITDFYEVADHLKNSYTFQTPSNCFSFSETLAEVIYCSKITINYVISE